MKGSGVGSAGCMFSGPISEPSTSVTVFTEVCVCLLVTIYCKFYAVSRVPVMKIEF